MKSAAGRRWKGIVWTLVLGIQGGWSSAAYPSAKTIRPMIDGDVLKLLQDICAISSGSASERGQDLVRQRLIPEFEGLGMKSKIDTGSNGRKVISFTKGGKARLVMVGHIDTVFNEGKPSPTWKVEDDMITGPGVIDMKGGIALMFAVLKELKEDLGDQALNGIVVALNDDEEIGSGGTKDILRVLTKGTEAALVFEPGLADSALVSAHSGLDWIKLSVKGKAAHAGLEPERGVNACVELAAKIVEIQKLNDYPRRVSVSPDLIEGGTTVNTICENASVTMDFRYPDVAARDQVRRRLQEISDKTLTRKDQKPSDFKVELTYQVSTDPMSADKTQKLVAVAREVAKSLGQTFEARPVGYLSDGNNLADLGVPLLVGLGPYGGGMHTDHEFMKVSSFAERKALAKGLLRRILGL